ncbi:MAG: hypothetical protein RLZZ112_991 [Verrucomicrobiota bacterium]
MRAFSAPEGFQTETLPTGPAWFRPDAKKPILTFWKRTDAGLPLGKVTCRHPDSRRFPGRGTVVSAPFPGLGTVILRPCVHGGLWGRLARDLYPGPGRVRREIVRSERLAQLGIPTPRILAALFYSAGPFFRMEVASSFIQGGRDLNDLLSSRPLAGQRSRIFSSVRKLLEQLKRHGLRHPDLNARNILLSPTGAGNWTAWLLDVDTVRLGDPASPAVDTANRHRLLRSLLKLARLGDLGWSEQEVPRLWRELFPDT